MTTTTTPGERLTVRHLRRLEEARWALGARAATATMLLFGRSFSSALATRAGSRSDVELIDLERLYADNAGQLDSDAGTLYNTAMQNPAMRTCHPLLTALALTATGCGPPDSGSGPPGGAPEGAERATVEILVSAAASLTDAFTDIETAFEAAHRGADVVLNLAGSSALREQILEGAPADVFASANRTNMDRLVAAGEVAGVPRIFARNLLQIAVPRGNPAGIEGLPDFAEPDLLLGLCAPEVPCGDLARRALAKAGVSPALDTNEPDVRALLTKIELGELDAGITYVTDVASTGRRVEGVDIPASGNVVAEYPIAVLAGAPHPEAAGDFVTFVLSEAGSGILERHGFTVR